MASNATSANSTCAPADNLCTVATYRLDAIVVPTVLLLLSALTLLVMFLSGYRRRERADDSGRRRRRLRGIDAPPGLDPLEHEEVPMAVRPGRLERVRPLPPTALPVAADAVRLYRARMDGEDVVLRALRDSADEEERRRFSAFASLVSGLGPHPNLPAVLAAAPGLMVMEELRHGDLLGFLWKCRRPVGADARACRLTEKRLFGMAAQVASALEYLHSRRCVHGNVCARSVLVGADLTAKLWGLGRRPAPGRPAQLKKWRAPEVLAGGDLSPAADVWSFGLLLYEMITLGEPPFARVPADRLLSHLQEEEQLPPRPPGCPAALSAVMSSCCRRSPRRRLAAAALARRLRAGEQGADGRAPIRAAGPLDLERYLRQAGYGEAHHYALL